MDYFSKKERSLLMAKIKSSKTKPELILKKALRGLSFSYQPKVKGKPDFADKKLKLAVFLHGCFWHGCKKHCRMPKSNTDYWVNKIKNNIKRDCKNKVELKKGGYKVITIWEHELSNLNNVLKKINE